MAEKKITLENAFEQLEEIISKMDDADVSLEKSFDLYHKGVKLVQFCNDRIDKVEKQIQIINEED